MSKETIISYMPTRRITHFRPGYDRRITNIVRKSAETMHYQQPPLFLPQIPTEITRLQGEVNQLREAMEQLRAQLADLNPGRMIVIRELSYPQAKKEVEMFIKTAKTTDLEKIQDSLRIDLRLIVKIVKELEKENKIRTGE